MVKTGRVIARFGAVVLALSTGACVALLGMDRLSERPVADTADVEAGEPGVCGIDDVGLPAKPPAGQPSSDGGSVYFAFDELDLGIDAGAEPPGLDLDRRVTTDVRTNGCTFADAGDPQAALLYGLDPPSGVDNTVLQLLRLLSLQVAGFAPSSINQRLVDRQFGFVLRIDDWNLTKNDDSVAVFGFPAIGYWRGGADGGFVPGEVPPSTPIDAGDLWMPDQRFAISSKGSSLLSTQAWVTEGTLVARFETFTVPFRTSSNELRPFDLELHDAWLTGTLSSPTDGTRPSLLHGTIAGRVTASALAQQIGFLFDLTTMTYLCETTNGVAEIAVSLGCGARDIAASHCGDGKGVPCDALSFGARFETYAVDELGPPRKPADDEYRSSPGRLPPQERCRDVVDSGLACPP